MRTETREVAATGLHQEVYDNINFAFRNSEQTVGRHGKVLIMKLFCLDLIVISVFLDSQENGTCATLIPLFDAKIEDLKITDFQNSFLNAPPLKLADLMHSETERAEFRQNLIFSILRIIVKQGKEEFKKFERDLEKNQPQTSEKIPLHQTKLHLLPTWNIDESTIIGNADVDQAIVNELDLENSPVFKDHVRFLAGDQLSLARLRSLEVIHAGQEGGYHGFFWGTWVAGLFHAKLADASGTLISHWGKPDTGSRNPGSLWFHNTRLDRLPIQLSSPPPFRTTCDLIFVSLYARVLHCLLLVSSHQSLNIYLSKVDKWDIVVSHAEMIYDKFTDTALMDELRWDRDESGAVDDKGDPVPQGDMVFENAILFLRDVLISREFSDAIKAGDSGRVLLVLKAWALSFRGNGRTKYAYKMLHVIHNLTNVWPKPIR
jgi:hypothetical protein